mmetsp:Transcript_15034/g.24897  ORF Transcript_15034/g.24897 Transcript_15034/m.24897 type:complete len:90 (-) Transcript_15034:114-383(-)
MAKAISANDKFKDYPIPNSAGPKTLFWILAPLLGMKRSQIWRGIGHVATLDNSKGVKDLKTEYHSIEDTFQDMFGQMVDAGMIELPKKK